MPFRFKDSRETRPASFSVMCLSSRQSDDHGRLGWIQLIMPCHLLTQLQHHQQGIHRVEQNGDKRLDSVGKETTTQNNYIVLVRWKLATVKIEQVWLQAQSHYQWTILAAVSAVDIQYEAALYHYISPVLIQYVIISRCLSSANLGPRSWNFLGKS